MKFRGKRLNSSEWVYGSLLWHESEPMIMAFNGDVLASDVYYVDPDTVGQYTGLRDKNGEEIYEDDIVEVKIFGRAVVEWDENRFVADGDGFTFNRIAGITDSVSVIGNIIDNPELIKN